MASQRVTTSQHGNPLPDGSLSRRQVLTAISSPPVRAATLAKPLGVAAGRPVPRHSRAPRRPVPRGSRRPARQALHFSAYGTDARMVRPTTTSLPARR
jgi:hypothetical protein